MLVKKTQRLISSLIIFSFLLGHAITAYAQSFNDVAPTNRNFTAIEYLTSKKIINGYPDGTFRPDIGVNRAEFLKLVLGSSGILNDITTPTGFKDVDEKAWYAPYLRKAKEEKWIEGYPDNTFKPEQIVNKAEALKIIAKIQKWQTSTINTAPFQDVKVTEWYAPFVNYAKEQNFLEETGKLFIPAAPMSRAKTSEVLFRALITKEKNADRYNVSLASDLEFSNSPTPNQPTQTPTQQPSQTQTPAQENFTPVEFQKFSDNFFNNIKLNEDFPNTFYANEIYQFEGSTITGNYKIAFIYLKDKATGQEKNIATTLENNQFKIPVQFTKPGNYTLGLILGNEGTSKAIDISVLSQLPTPTVTATIQPPTNTTITYKDQQTNVSWNDPLVSDVHKITFSQDQQQFSYFTRQNLSSLNINYSDFKNFKEGKVNMTIEAASTQLKKPLLITTDWAKSTPLTFNAVTHQTNFIPPEETTNKPLITWDSLPETSKSTGAFNLNGTVLEDTYQQAVIIKPNQAIERVNLLTSKPTQTSDSGQKIITGGSDYHLTYQLNQLGTYILEINHEDGHAVMNIGIYVGDIIPFIPDFFDLNDRETTEKINDKAQARSTLFQLVNKERQTAGVPALQEDSTLTNMAQSYADYMAANNFVSHVSPDGTTTEDRRKAAGITTYVGENLAQAPTILYNHYGLMRSAIHRENLLDPNWNRVGVGVAQSASGGVIVVEEFNIAPMSESELINYNNKLISMINQARASLQTSPMTNDASLHSIADNWSKLMADQKFFDSVSPNGSSLETIVAQQETARSVQGSIYESLDLDQLTQKTLENDQLTLSLWKAVGIGLRYDTDGLFKLTLLFADEQ